MEYSVGIPRGVSVPRDMGVGFTQGHMLLTKYFQNVLGNA